MFNIGDKVYVEINGTNEVREGVIVSKKNRGFWLETAYIVELPFGLRGYIESKVFPYKPSDA